MVRGPFRPSLFVDPAQLGWIHTTKVEICMDVASVDPVTRFLWDPMTWLCWYEFVKACAPSYVSSLPSSTIGWSFFSLGPKQKVGGWFFFWLLIYAKHFMSVSNGLLE